MKWASQGRMSGREVGSTRQDDMLARNLSDSTYVPRPYLAVGRKKRAGASRARGWSGP